MEQEKSTLTKSEGEELPLPEIPKDILKYHVFDQLLKQLIEENTNGVAAIKRLAMLPFPFNMSEETRKEILKIYLGKNAIVNAHYRLLELAIRRKLKELYNYILDLAEKNEITLSQRQKDNALSAAEKKANVDLISRLTKLGAKKYVKKSIKSIRIDI